MGFLEPRNLLWGLGLAVLVAIYLRSRSRRTIDVSSLMLFEAAPAPSAAVRKVRIDPFFWLETAALGALALAAAGMFYRAPASAGIGHSRALVFNLGAAMGSHSGAGSRLDAARREAGAMVDSAPAGEQFSVIEYSLEAQVTQPPTTDPDAVRVAIAGLRASAVAPREAALSAAMMRAAGASEIHLFTDRQPPPATITAASAGGHVTIHRIEGSTDNLALVSLDPGVPNVSRGRVVVRNFAIHPQTCELSVSLGAESIYHQTLILAPRETAAAEFGPLATGGLVRAQIAGEDALEADNTRYALTPTNSAASAIVVSPDGSVRDEIARILTAIDPNFRVETVDAAHVPKADPAAKPYALAIVHDSSARPNAAATLYIFPPPAAAESARPFDVISTSPAADLRSATQTNAAGIALGPARVLRTPDWMDVSATIVTPSRTRSPAVAVGKTFNSAVGVIAFDPRGHLLLNADHLDALVATVNAIRQLTAPAGIEIVIAGSFVSIPAGLHANVLSPGEKVAREVSAGNRGRIMIRPMQAGRYIVASGSRTTDIYANYYDAVESDLIAAPPASSGIASAGAGASVRALSAVTTRSLDTAMILLAIAALLVESTLLARRAAAWRGAHV